MFASGKMGSTVTEETLAREMCGVGIPAERTRDIMAALCIWSIGELKTLTYDGPMNVERAYWQACERAKNLMKWS